MKSRIDMNTPLKKISALMGIPRFARRADLMPAAMVLGLLLFSGSRLITLSMQHHAAQAREAAQGVVDSYGRAIEGQLQHLARQAQRSAASAPSASPAPGRRSFRLTADGTVVNSAASDTAEIQAIRSEWAAADSGPGAAPPGAAVPGFLGPVRYLSQWLVAVRVPVMVPARQRSGWSIAYQTLDALLTDAGLRSRTGMGYDFELSQHEATSSSARVLWTTAAGRLSEPVARRIRLPANLAPSPRGAALTIAARPRAGWYPAGTLATDIGLLILVTWLLTVSSYDVSRELRRLHAALRARKRRMRALHQRLVNEIEQRQTLQKSFDHARYHDAFTGLPNREYFVARLEQALHELRIRHGHVLAVVLIDIERFGLINDTLGHTAGDEVMDQAARRFERASAAFEGVLARWGGDQFVLLLFDVHSKDTAVGAAGLLRESLRAPFKVRKHLVSVAARIGVTWVDVGARRAEDVLREADIALSAAKSRADTPVVAYDAAMGGEALALVSLEADLHVALDRDQLLLLFQPIVDLRTSRVVGAEALLRWRHPVEGVLTPDRFLPIAEEVGLTVPITRWTIWRACRVAAEWRRMLPPQTEFCISVNLSAAALRDPTLADHVESVLRETHTPARVLKLELTEGGLIRDIRAAKEVLARLHEMGIELMLDDFGSGYSSLSHLQFFPFDYVKIDRPVASGRDSTRDAITSAMVRMASSLGLRTVAELVETEEGVLALQQAGCDYAQGYFFCEPVRAEEALRRLLLQESRVPRPEMTARQPEGRPNDSPATPTPRDDDAELAIEPPAIVPVVDDSPTPRTSDDTMVFPVEDSASPLPGEETMAFSTDEPLAQGLSDETLALPIDESPAPDQHTQQLALEELGLPFDDSPTRAEPVEFIESIDAEDDSPTPKLPDESHDKTPWLGPFRRKRGAR